MKDSVFSWKKYLENRINPYNPCTVRGHLDTEFWTFQGFHSIVIHLYLRVPTLIHCQKVPIYIYINYTHTLLLNILSVLAWSGDHHRVFLDRIYLFLYFIVQSDGIPQCHLVRYSTTTDIILYAGTCIKIYRINMIIIIMYYYYYVLL